MSLSLNQIQDYNHHTRADRDETHGSHTAYNRGCLCNACREAESKYRRERREARRNIPKVCEGCGVSFMAADANTRLCRRACRDTPNRLPRQRPYPVRDWVCPGDPSVMLNSAREAEALQVCAECPAKGKCREEAIEHYEMGVWGGTTDAERARLRRGGRVTEQ